MLSIEGIAVLSENVAIMVFLSFLLWRRLQYITSRVQGSADFIVTARLFFNFVCRAASANCIEFSIYEVQVNYIKRPVPLLEIIYVPEWHASLNR